MWKIIHALLYLVNIFFIIILLNELCESENNNNIIKLLSTD